ncbi:MAG: nuclear transport factor 2 family protein [Actinomycetota bacterium]|nr:nuclear transport factor 2 family protein [Actinomycetota bacterium]
MDRAEVEAWVEDLRSAWEAANPVQIGALFADDAEYLTTPFGKGLQGRDSIVAYWSREMSTQDRVEVRMGRPVIDGERVAVEWWAVITSNGSQITDAGALMLELSGDRCRRLAEYWMLEEGGIEPAEGWGAEPGSKLIG